MQTKSPSAITEFKNYFSNLKDNANPAFASFYSDTIQFTDPIHSIHGLPALKEYFEMLNANLYSGHFEFTEETITSNKAFLSWTMHLELKKPKKQIRASGISVLTFSEKITHQRDYFDAGEVFYEHIPLIGSLIKWTKNKLNKSRVPNVLLDNKH